MPVRYAFVKQGIYYFTRRVPSDLRGYYGTDRISFSLKTKSAKKAKAQALAQAAKLDQFWFNLRLHASDVPGNHRLLNEEERHRKPSPTIQEAKALYLKLRGEGRTKTFHMGAERAVDYLIESAGNKALLAFTKSDATGFRDALYSRGLSTSSVARTMTTVKAIVGFVLSEKGISAANPFSSVYLNRTVRVERRKPIPLHDIRAVQARCRLIDDDIRWLLALISDTGMRLAEAAGLEVSDFNLIADIPHLVIQPHGWRSLKNFASERSVPLVGEALWASKRIVQDRSFGLAFPRYNRSERTNANSASAALNKWLKDQLPAEYVVHSFRHSLRDRLRAVQCPSDVVDQIGGWTSPGKGQAYGSGYPLDVLQSWLGRIA